MSEQMYRLVATIVNTDGEVTTTSGKPMPKALAERWLEHANNQSYPSISIRHHLEPVPGSTDERG